MLGLPRRTLVSSALALAALAAAVDFLLLAARGSSAPAWSHWWCSPSALHASPHHPASGLVATVLKPLMVLLPHWPHTLPIFLALATLFYLRRADASYRTHKCQIQTGS